MSLQIDLAQAEAFVTALTGSPSTILVFQLADDMPEGEPRRDQLSRVIIGSVRQHHAILSRMNALGAAVWIQVNEGRRGNRNVTGLRALFVDDDGKSEDAPEIVLPPTIVVASSLGERNRHYYWRLSPGEGIERFTPAQKQLIAALSTDKSVNNLDRCMRLPGSFNMKRANVKRGMPEPVRLLYAHSGRQYTIDEVLAAFPIEEEEARALVAEPQPDLFTDDAKAMARRIAIWLTEQQVTFTQKSPISFLLARCVFNPAHVDKMAIKVLGRGGVWAGCFHDSCGGNANRWAQVKDRVGGWTSNGGFSRGDGVELASRLLVDLANNLDEPLIYDEGKLWRYPGAGLWHAVGDVEQERCIAGYAGRSVGKRVLLVGGDTMRSTRACVRALANAQDFFATAAPGIAFSNGFLGVTPAGAAFMPHSPEHRQRAGLPFPYEGRALCPRWFAFMTECFRDDDDAPAKMDLLQEFVGACLVGLATRYQKALLLVGEGHNGKSVFTNVVFSLFPESMRAAVKPQDFGSEYTRAYLAGIRCNVVSETPEAEILSSDAFKAIISGEAIVARRPYGEPFSHRPIAGHIFAANRLPGTGDHSHGFYRRFALVPWNRRFTMSERDAQLTDYLCNNELPAIAAWAVRGAERLLSRGSEGGYTEPPSDAETRQHWREEVDQVAAFVQECTEFDGNGGTPARIVYQCFRAWLDQTGHRVMSETAFGRRMRGLQMGSRPAGAARTYPVRLTVPLPVSMFLN